MNRRISANLPVSLPVSLKTYERLWNMAASHKVGLKTIVTEAICFVMAAERYPTEEDVLKFLEKRGF